MTEQALQALARATARHLAAPEHIDLIAEAVADRLAERMADLGAPPPAEPLIDATEVARRLGVSREAVYAHAEELGAIRLGDTPKARLRFDPARVPAYQAGESEPAENGTPPKPTASRRRLASAELLPIRGERP